MSPGSRFKELRFEKKYLFLFSLLIILLRLPMDKMQNVQILKSA